MSGASSTVVDFGMPQDRRVRLAARQAFVDLKHDFMVAVAGLPGARGDYLRRVVRNAESADDLWRARRMLFGALAGNDADACSVRHSLQTGLHSLFADSEPPRVVAPPAARLIAHRQPAQPPR